MQNFSPLSDDVGCKIYRADITYPNGDQRIIVARKEDPACIIRSEIRKPSGEKSAELSDKIPQGLLLGYLPSKRDYFVSQTTPYVTSNPNETKIHIILPDQREIPCEETEFECADVAQLHSIEACAQVLERISTN